MTWKINRERERERERTKNKAQMGGGVGVEIWCPSLVGSLESSPSEPYLLLPIAPGCLVRKMPRNLAKLSRFQTEKISQKKSLVALASGLSKHTFREVPFGFAVYRTRRHPSPLPNAPLRHFTAICEIATPCDILWQFPPLSSLGIRSFIS